MNLFKVDKDQELGLKTVQFMEGIKSVLRKAAKEEDSNVPHLPWGDWNKLAPFEKEMEKIVKQVLRNQYRYAFTQGIREGVRRFCAEGLIAIVGKTGGFREGD